MFNSVDSDMVLLRRIDDSYTEMLKRGYSPIEVNKEHLQDLLYRYRVRNNTLEEDKLIAEIFAEVLREDTLFRSKYIGYMKDKRLEITRPIDYFVKRNNDFVELMIDVFKPEYGTLAPYSQAIKMMVDKLEGSKVSASAKPGFLYGDFKLIETLGKLKACMSSTEMVTLHSRQGYGKPSIYLKEVFNMLKRFTDDFKELTEIERDIFIKTMEYIEEVLGDERFEQDLV